MSSFSDLVKKTNEEDKKKKKKKEEEKSSFRDLVKGVNDGTISVKSKLNQSDVDSWYKNTSRVGEGAYNYLSQEGYKAKDSHLSLSNELTTYLNQANDVGQYLRANKSKIEDYDKVYQDYIERTNNLRSMNEKLNLSNEFYSQFETESDYYGHLMTNTGDKTDNDSVKARQDAYTSINNRIKQIDEEIAGLDVSDGYTTNEDGIIVKAPRTGKDANLYNKLLAEKDRLKTYIRQYERGNKYKDETFLQNATRDDYEEKSANRDFGNSTKEDYDEFDTKAYGGYIGYYDGTDSTRVEASPNYDVAGEETKLAINDPLGFYFDNLGAYAEKGENSYFSPDTVTKGAEYQDVLAKGDKLHWSNLNDDEIQMYYFILNEQGKNAALSFLDGMENELAYRESEEYKEYLKEASLAESLFFNALSVPANIVGGAVAVADDAINLITGQEIDSYNSAHAMKNFADDTRSASAERLNELTKNGEFLGMTAGDVYQALMSGVDSFAGASMFGSAYMGFMVAGAASSGVKDLYESGASTGQIISGAIINGLSEYIGEKIPLDNFFKMKGSTSSIGKAILNALKQGGYELGGEMITEVSNIIGDTINLRSESEWAKLLKENGGAFWDTVKQMATEKVWKAGAGGFISGMLMGGAGTATDYANTQSAYKAEGQAILDQGGVDTLKALALDLAGKQYGIKNFANKVALESQAKKVSSETQEGKGLGKITAAIKNSNNATAIGRLSDTVHSTISEQTKSEIKADLRKQGMSNAEATKITDEFMSVIEGDRNAEFSEELQSAIDKSVQEGSALGDTWAKVFAKDSKINSQYSRYNLARAGIEADDKGELTEEGAKIYEQKVAKLNKSLNENKSLPTEENVIESEYEVSADGKTVNKNTDKIVNIQKIESISEGGEANLTLDDGMVVKASDLAYGNNAEAIFIANIGKIKVGNNPINTASANALYQAAMNALKANPNMTGDEAMSLIKGLEESYIYGTYSLGRSKLTAKNENGTAQLFAGELSQEQRKFAYELGTRDRVSKVERDQKVINELKAKAKAKANNDTTAKPTAKKGRVRFKNGAVARGASQMRAVSLAKHLARAIGIDIVFYDSTMGGFGSDANGYFDRDTDTIYLDLQNSWDDAKTIVYTMSHELVHFIKKWSPEKFDTFAKFLMEQYGKHGVDTATLLSNKMTELGTNDEDYAYEEMIADACETMLLDSNAVYKLMELRKTDLELFEKIKLHIRNLLNKIRGMYEKLGLKPTSNEAKALLEMKDVLEQIYSLFEEAAVDAAQSYQAVQNSNETIFGEKSFDVGKTEPGIKNQLKNHKKIGEDATAYNERHKNVHKAVLQVGIESMYEMAETMLPYLEEEGILPPDIPGKTIFKNGSYGRTGENTTLCVRTLTYEDFKDRVAEEIGRPLTVSESLLVSQKIYDIATDPQCIYCYVAADRKAYDGYLGEYWKAMDKYIKAMRSGGDSQALYTEYLAGRKDTSQQRKRWSQWEAIAKSGKEYISANDLTTKRKRDVLIAKKNAFSEQIKDAQRYAQSASWAKTVFDYRAYKGDIIKMTSKFVDMLNSEYGLRMYSFSDYTPAFIVENMQMIIDASVKGLKSLAYTKDTDYAEIFASTGQAINVSCFAKWDAQLGTYVEDNRQGANWEKTISLRKQYRNVGAVMVATNDAMVEWALKQDWIDVVIPYHIVKTGTTIANEYQWNNYTSESADRVGNKTANIYPTEHNNDFATYSNLLNERGITPRFSRWYDMVASGKLTENQYMKLVNEVRLPASELSAVVPSFNIEAAKKSFGIDNEGKVIKGGFVDKGGYMGGWYRQGVDVNQEVMAVSEDIKAGKSSLDVDYGMSKAAKEKVEARYKKQAKSNSRITFGMSDTERSEILKEKTIAAPFYQGQADALIEKNKESLESQQLGLVKAAIATIGEEFGIIGEKINVTDVDVVITLSKSNLKESVSKDVTPIQLAKLLPVLKVAVGNAVGIESHNNRYYFDTDTVYFENLLGGYIDGEDFVPVRFGLKHSVSGKTTLYVVVDQNKIKANLLKGKTKTEVLKATDPHKVGSSASRSVDYDIPQILQFVNSKDLLRYIPDDMLNAEQKTSKWEAIAETIKKTDAKNDKKYAEFISKGNLYAAQRMVDEAAKAAGYTRTVYHGTASKFTVFGFGRAGIFTTDNHDMAKTYGDNVISLYGKEGAKVLTIDAQESPHYAIRVSKAVLDFSEYPLMRGKELYSTNDISRIAFAEGYDVVVIKNVYDNFSAVSDNKENGLGTDVVYKDSNQVKSSETITYDDEGNIIPISQRFDNKKNDIRYQKKRDSSSYAPTFYSQMGKVIEGVKQDKLAANSVVNMLRGKGVKAEEIRWSGIVPFLEGKKSVTKQELLDFINGSMLEIGEQMSGARYMDAAGKRIHSEESFREAAYLIADEKGIDRKKVEFMLDGGDIYAYAGTLSHGEILYAEGIGGARWSEYKLDGGTNYREIVFTLPNSSYRNKMMKVHWGEDAEGILVHARIQDFDVNGKKMLFIEEIQSDWHNEGHKDGYQEDEKLNELQELEAKANEAFLALEDYSTELTGLAGEYEAVAKTQKGRELLRAKIRTEKELKQAQAHFDSKVPDAPFKENYHEFVLKRLLRMAAEQGYDSIGWTPSEIQSDRWSDEFAEAYRIEYDQEMPKFLRKYGRQWGAKVEKTRVGAFEQQIDVDSQTSLDDDVWLLADGISSKGTEIWSMDITDSMKNSVLYEGQVLYQKKTDTNRSILANALEGATQTDIEKNKLKEYKEKISLIESEEQRLSEIQKQLFTKGGVEPSQRKDLQFEAKQIANRINTYDRQLFNLESTTALKNVLNREKALAMKRQKQKDAEKMREYKEKVAKTTKELINRNQESRKKAIESREKTAMRHKIKTVVNDLNTLLLKPTKERHVPEEMKIAVAEALEIVNMDTVAADERVAHYNDLIAKAKDPDVIASLTETRDRILNQGNKLADKLTKLKDAYGMVRDSADDSLQSMYDDVVYNKIESVQKKVGKTPIRNMTLEQLENVYELYTMVLTFVRDSNKAFAEDLKMTRQALGSNTFAEIKENNKARDVIKHESIEKFMWQYLKPMQAIKTIGSGTLQKLWNNILYGQEIFAQDYDEAVKFAKEMKEKYGYKKWDLTKTYSFESKSGKKMKINLEQMMSIYAYSKRKQADEHIEFGGIVLNEGIIEEKNKLGKTVEYKVNDSTAYRLNKMQVDEIIETLEKEAPGAKTFVDEMQKYLSETMGAKGNEVAMKMYGIKLFKEEHYFPLKSSKDFMEAANAKLKGDVKIKNKGMTKSVVEHARNPIVLENFLDVWGNHINEMAMYHGLVLPLEDFSRTLNYSFKADDSLNTDAESVRTALHDAFGENADNYLNELLKAINGGVLHDSSAAFADKMISKFKKAKVMASLSVVVQQPTAIIRAMGIIEPKYFVAQNFSHKATWEELKKYCPTAIIKETGSFDTNMGRTIVDMVKDERGFTDKVGDVLGKAPAYMDEMGWNMIWRALKKKVATEQKLSGEELLKECGKQMTLIINETQVYDSVMSRNELMRSKNALTKMATAFMAEPATVANMIYGAALDFKRGYKGKASKAVVATITSVVINGLVSSLVYALRDDDEEKTLLEKYLSSTTTEVLDGLNPLTYIPYIKDAYSLFQGYKVERTDLALISDVVDAVNTFYDVLNPEKYEGMSRKEIAKHIYENSVPMLTSICDMFGLPVGNILRDAKAIIINDNVPMSQTSSAGIGYAFKEGSMSTMPKIVQKIIGTDSKQDKLYDAIVSGDSVYIKRLKSTYKDDKSYESAVRMALRENDPRIREAAEARNNGNIAEYTRIVKKIKAEGFFSQDTIVASVNAEINAINKGESSTSNTATECKTSSIYKIEDYYASIVGGDQASAYVVKEDIINTDIANGKDRDEAEESFNSRFASHVREQYEDGNLFESEAAKMLVNYGGKSEEEASSKVQYWEFKQEYPDYDDLSEEAVAKYYDEVEPYGISIDVYYDYSKQRSKCKGVDANGDGKTDSGSVKKEVLKAINSLPITKAQKDALYYLNGWSAKTIKEAPWR